VAGWLAGWSAHLFFTETCLLQLTDDSRRYIFFLFSLIGVSLFCWLHMCLRISDLKTN